MSDNVEKRLDALEKHLLESVETQEDMIEVVERLALLVQRLLEKP